MVATATKPATKARQSKSLIVDTLSHLKLDERRYNVESRSLTLGFHIVRRDSHGEWRCDSECRGYETLLRCSHVATVLRAEREAVEAFTFCCGCYGPAGDMLACSCPCHLDGEPLPTPDVTSDVLYFPDSDLVVSVTKADSLDCERCEGNGSIVTNPLSGNMKRRKCPACKGEGTLPEEPKAKPESFRDGLRVIERSPTRLFVQHRPEARSEETVTMEPAGWHCTCSPGIWPTLDDYCRHIRAALKHLG